MRSAPARSASRTSRVASPGPWVIASSNGNTRAMVSARSRQRLPSLPPCERGLTTTTVRGLTIARQYTQAVCHAEPSCGPRVFWSKPEARSLFFYPGPSRIALSIFVLISTYLLRKS